MSRTAKYLTILLLLNLLISLMATTGLLMFILSQRPADHNNLRCDFSGLLFGIGWGIIILLVISSVTLYLNLYKKVRSNGWLSLFSFFLLPLFTAAILLPLMGAITESIQEYAAIFLPFFSSWVFSTTGSGGLPSLTGTKIVNRWFILLQTCYTPPLILYHTYSSGIPVRYTSLQNPPSDVPAVHHPGKHF